MWIKPITTEFGSRHTHDFNTRFSLSKSRFSPKAQVARSSSPVSVPRAGIERGDSMSTPHHSHRGLPPPAAMALPEPARPGPSPALSSQLGAIPDPPRQWAGQEEPMRNWLAAKAEEDKRKQEEEKTRQESLRLEQRRIESEMLRESLRAGVPPAMVPMIYAGIGGGNLFNISMDWLQQYAGQLQVSQQQVQQASPDMRRDGRLIAPPAPPSYPPGQQPQLVAGQHAESQPPAGPLQTTFPAYQQAPPRQPQHNTAAPRSATHTQLPRLTTNEIYAPQPPAASVTPHPLQQSQTLQQEPPASSPSIYFHHWVPPQESKSNQQPQTPANKTEPSSAHPGSSLRDDYKESPRKRKAPGEHQANPPPSAGPQYTSPSFSVSSTTSRHGGRGHARTRSTISMGRETDTSSRPESSSNRRDELPPPQMQKRDSAHHDGNGHGQGGGEEASQGPASYPKDEPSSAPSVAAADLSRFREAHPAEPRPGSC